MSKWNLQKILGCEEIKFGTKMKTCMGFEYLVLTKLNSSFTTITEFEEKKMSWDSGEDRNIESMKFFRSNGTEILPPKEMVMKKFYLFVKSDGQATSYFYSKDLKTYWSSGVGHCSPVDASDWTRTNCFIEKEVEA